MRTDMTLVMPAWLRFVCSRWGGAAQRGDVQRGSRYGVESHHGGLLQHAGPFAGRSRRPFRKREVSEHPGAVGVP